VVDDAIGDANDGDDEAGGRYGRLVDMIFTVGLDCVLVVGDVITLGELLGVPNRTDDVDGVFVGDRDEGTDVGEDDIGNNGGGVNPVTSGFDPSMTPDDVSIERVLIELLL